MPRFYFHICNGHGFIEDEEGVDLPDEPAARRNAVEAARDVMAGDLREGRLDLTSFIEVEDEAHRLLFTLTFAEAVRVNTVPDPARRRPQR
ncbi:MAG: hypothetical protein QOE79_2555 [Sphingomonadales bacterium]|jgi:hypothetical protein|nr:hypothetical protein [Sphingomonadales bacterium]MEA3048313.1 hypothetical protein [Sphingomonadales bacterium]